MSPPSPSSLRIVFSSDLHGNLFQYQKLVDYANHEDHHINCMIIGGDLYLKNKKHSNLDEYSHLDCNKGIEKHRDYFANHLLPILKQFKKGNVYICFGNADLYSDVAFMKEKTQHIPNIKVLYNEVIQLDETDLELFAYSSIVFMKGHKKDFERFDTSNISDTLAQNLDWYHIRLKGYTTFNESEFLDVILNGEYPECSCVEENPSEDSHFKGVPGFHHLKFDPNDPKLVKAFSIERELERIAEKYNFTKEKCRKQLWVCHMPPYDTCCDNVNGIHCGSRALRRAIEQYQPLMTMHGHIHCSVDSSQGQYCSKIGDTFCYTSGNYPKSKDMAILVLDTSEVSSCERKII